MTIFKFPVGKKYNNKKFLILDIDDDENILFFTVEVLEILFTHPLENFMLCLRGLSNYIWRL